MELSQALGLGEKGVISVIGGGGKTSLMVALAGELSRRGKVVVTTTTHMGPTQAQELCAPLLLDGREDTFVQALATHPVVCMAREEPESGKLRAPAPELLQAALDRAAWVLAEADGSRCMPVKAPAGHEPVFLPDTDLVIAVAGLSALGRPLREVAHRLELVCDLLGAEPEHVLTPAMLARLLTSERGQFKGVGNVARYHVLLNQADGPRELELARETAREIAALRPGCAVTAVCLRPRAQVRACS